MKKIFVLLLLPFSAFGQAYTSIGSVASMKAAGGGVTVNWQHNDLYSTGIGVEVLHNRDSKATTVAGVLANQFTLSQNNTAPVLIFNIGHTVLPSHGAYMEGGGGVLIGRLQVTAAYRYASMPRTEATDIRRGVNIMGSGVFVKVGVEW